MSLPKAVSGMTILAPGMFGDELVSATDLSRRAGWVLDQALERPVTVTRGTEAFALLRREDAAWMAHSKANAQLLADLAMAVYRLLFLSPPPEPDHSFAWLTAFDKDELGELFSEVSTAFKVADAAGSWEEFEAVLHEWHESALAIGNPELAQAFAASPTLS